MDKTEQVENLVSVLVEGIGEVISSLGGEMSGKFEVIGFDVVSKSNVGECLKLEQVYFWGRVEKNQGGIGIGFSESIVVAMLRMLGYEVEAVSEDLRQVILELCEALLGGVLGKVCNTLGKGVIQFERVQVSLKNQVESSIIEEFFVGNSIGICSIRFSGGITDGVVTVLFDEGVGNWFGIEFLDEKSLERSERKIISEEEVENFLREELQNKKYKGEEVMSESNANMKNLGVILGIEVEVVARLGSVEMPLSSVLSLGPGSVVNVGHLVDEPIELYVNNKLIARGDVVIVDEKFGVRITEVVSQEERIESLR